MPMPTAVSDTLAPCTFAFRAIPPLAAATVFLRVKVPVAVMLFDTVIPPLEAQKALRSVPKVWMESRAAREKI